MKVGLLSLMLAVAGTVIPAAAQAVAQTYQLDIPRQQLDAALKDLAQQTGLQIARFSDTPGASAFVGPVKGDMPVTDALKTLLEPSKLTYKIVNDHTIAVMSLSSAAVRQTELPSPSGSSQSSGVTAGDPNQQEGKKSFWDNFRLAQANQGVPQRSSTVGSDFESSSGSSQNSPPLTEIVVTARKKTERLQDVPESITVLDPQALAENGQNSLLDYFDSVPGLNVAGSQGFGGEDYITIRGLSAGSNQNPIVATVIDDVPAASSVARSLGGFTSPDLDPSDLARIEVLKGPQGTLYGADSLGGLIKYVTADPSTQGLSGRVQVSGVDIPGGGLGYAVRGAVNIPVSDSFALRVSGFDRRDPGYIDDLTTGQNNFNSADVYGGHFAALWRPSDNLSLKLSALVQQAQGNSSQYDSTPTGQSLYTDLGLHSLPGTTGYTTQDQLYSATFDWKVAGFDIVSVTGYVVNSLTNWGDSTTAFGSTAYACQQQPNPASNFYCYNQLPPGANPNGIDGVPYFGHERTRKPTEELRISSSIGHWLDWRIGGFYTHEEGRPTASGFYGANPTTGAMEFPFYIVNDTTQTFEEHAAFGDFTVHIADRFDVEFGGRESWNKQADQIQVTGLATDLFFGALPPAAGPLLQASGSAFTYQVAPRFKITPDLMAYARIATGYRIGGYNSTYGLPASAAFQIPASFSPDKTTNYELGIKGDLLQHRLSFDAAVYYINWKNFQTAAGETVDVDGSEVPYGYTANAGNAKSEGVEFSIEGHPLEGLTITAQGSYDDAELTGSLPATGSIYGVKGTQLPYSMRLSGGLTANQDFRLTNDWTGFIGAALNHVGARPWEFVGTPAPGQQPAPRTVFPAYTPLNLSTGARYHSLRTNLYLNNVTNRRGILGFAPASSVGNPDESIANVIQPRTIGLSVSQNF